LHTPARSASPSKLQTQKQPKKLSRAGKTSLAVLTLLKKRYGNFWQALKVVAAVVPGRLQGWP
jgi:hypothetical protein